MMKLLTVLFFAFFLAGTAAAQAPAAEKGTYQYFFKARGLEEEIIALSDKQLEIMERLRDEEKSIYVRISEITVVRILPRKTITDPSFDPSKVEEKLYYVEQNVAEFGNAYENVISLQ
jgi:hypothetical protein